MKKQDPCCHLDDVLEEYQRATKQHGSFNSAHEGYAVILEELDELWEEVRKKAKQRSKEYIRKEAIQIAAMAVRFITDICDK
jgi:NTP pyrophosphatase (non-canonical NTP hydrolase)